MRKNKLRIYRLYLHRMHLYRHYLLQSFYLNVSIIIGIYIDKISTIFPLWFMILTVLIDGNIINIVDAVLYWLQYYILFILRYVCMLTGIVRNVVFTMTVIYKRGSLFKRPSHRWSIAWRFVLGIIVAQYTRNVYCRTCTSEEWNWRNICTQRCVSPIDSTVLL